MPEEVDLAERKLTQMQIEEQALMKETRRGQSKRAPWSICASEIADAPRTAWTKRKAEWQNEKDVIENVADAQGRPWKPRKPKRSAPPARAIWSKASEIRYAPHPRAAAQA